MCLLRTKPGKFSCQGGLHRRDLPLRPGLSKTPHVQGGEGTRAGETPGGSLEGPQGILPLTSKPRCGWMLTLESFPNFNHSRKERTRNKNPFKCISIQHRAASHWSRGIPPALFLLSNTLMDLWGLILTHLLEKRNLCFSAAVQYKRVVKSLERMEFSGDV